MNASTTNKRAGGKQQLIDAALKLAAEKHSFCDVGLRELAREAGLNPNTFYRHFQSMDELGVCMVDEIGGQFRQALNLNIPADHPVTDLIDQGLEQLFAFALQHRQAIMVAACERYSRSTAIREALEGVLDEIQQDVASAAQALPNLDGLSPASIDEITEHIIHYCFRIIIDYLEKPEQRAQIKAAARRYVLLLFSGAFVLETQQEKSRA